MKKITALLFTCFTFIFSMENGGGKEPSFVELFRDAIINKDSDKVEAAIQVISSYPDYKEVFWKCFDALGFATTVSDNNNILRILIAAGALVLHGGCFLPPINAKDAEAVDLLLSANKVSAELMVSNVYLKQYFPFLIDEKQSSKRQETLVLHFPLIFAACIPNNVPIVQKLLASPLPDTVIKTCMLAVLRSHDVSMVQAVINRGVNLNSPYKKTYFPLNLAVSIPSSIEIIQLLLAYGARTDIIDTQGAVPLHIIVKHPNNAAIIRLLATSTTLNKQNRAGQTPLHIAASLPHNEENIRILLLLGADMYIKNKQNIEPINILRAQGYDVNVLLWNMEPHTIDLHTNT